MNFKKLFRWVKTYFAQTPFYTIFYITSRCNARCQHCFNWKLIEDSPNRHIKNHFSHSKRSAAYGIISKDRCWPACLVCHCSIAGGFKKSLFQKRFSSWLSIRACSLSYTYVLACIHNENIRPPSFVSMYTGTFSFFRLSCSLHSNIFSNFNRNMPKTGNLSFYDSCFVGLVGISSFISFFRISLGTHRILPV